jgi:hypothetical protein
VTLKNLKGVQTVEVSLEKGEAVAILAPGNTVRYAELLEAIDKNGFVVKGAKLVATGKVIATSGTAQFEVSRSGDKFRLEAATSDTEPATIAGRSVEIIGSVPESPKGKLPDVLRYESVEVK